MALPGMIYLGITHGIQATLLLVVYVACVTLFAIFFINALYLFILKITTPQKFQSIISYVQVIFAIVMYGSYQFFPRLIGQEELQVFDLTQYRLVMLYPIYWFGHGFDTLYHLQGPLSGWLSILLALVLPLGSIWVVVHYLAPSFNNKLAMITGATGPASAPKKTTQRNSQQRTRQDNHM